MKKNNAFRRAAALLAALSITVSLAAPAFAGTYYIDDGDITITKDTDGKQTVQQGETSSKDEGEIIITTHKKAITSLESDLEGPAAEDSGFGPVVEDNYQPAQPESTEEPEGADQPESAEEPKAADQPEGTDQPEDAEEPKDADQSEDDDQKKSTEESEDDDRQESAKESKDDDRQESAKESKDDDQKNAEESENTDRQESAEEQESAGQQPQPQQAAPADAAPAAPAPANGFCKNIITVINNAATALKLTLKDVKIDVSDTGTEDYPGPKAGKAALSVQGSGDVEIELDGDNELKSGAHRAGLEKNTSEGTLTLKDDNKEAGSLKATGGKYGAGIGGGNRGSGENITINGGTVEATGGDFGAGIGGGLEGSGKNITITGGKVTAAGGKYGAGIGGGHGGSGEDITITGGTVNAAGGEYGAGIGGGCWGSGEDITINGGTVNATGGTCGAGIGGGEQGNGGYGGIGSNVTVSGAAQVTAIAGKPDGRNGVGAGATIGGGGSHTVDSDGNPVPIPGTEIQADIKGLTTGWIHHIINKPDGTLDWHWYDRRQPTPDAPPEESNEVDLGTPGLHVETLEGDLLPFDARQQGSTLRVTTDNLAARLHGTRQALEALREQGVEQIQFVTSFKTTTLSVAELLAEGGSWFALEHNGLGSRQLSAAQAESLKCRMR